MSELSISGQTDSFTCEAGLTLSVSPIKLIAISNPTSPGTASSSNFRGLPLIEDQLKAPEIEPPVRPKSTPFSWQEALSNDKPIWPGNGTDQIQALPIRGKESKLSERSQSPSPKLTFSRLPTEIHELVLDHLFGVRASTANSASIHGGWSTALRHSRRRQLSDMALLNQEYRELVQGRLFKHSELLPAISDKNSHDNRA